MKHYESGKWSFRLMMLVLGIAVAMVWPVRCNAQHPDVVRIRVQEGGGVFSAGSGTLIGVNEHGHGVVLTCWHLFRDSDGPNFVDFPSGERRGATLIHKTEADDLAVLIIADPPSNGTPLSESDMPKGSAATIAGYGQGNYLEQSGRVAAFACFNGRTSEARVVTVQARQGDSGGPIFDGDGKVCGVISCAATGETLGTCGPQVWRFMQQCGPNGCPTYTRPRLVPVRPPQIAPRPTAPLPILKEPRRQKPINGNSAGVELTPARPLLPSGRSDDIQDLKQAVSDLSKAVANIEKSLDKPPAEKPITDIADLKPASKGCNCGTLKPCNCDPDKIAAAVLAKIKLPEVPKPATSKHVVIVANQDADYWPRLKGEIERAQKSYHGIRIAPLPEFPIGTTPQAVIYENGIPVKVVKGAHDVDELLATLRRGEFGS